MKALLFRRSVPRYMLLKLLGGRVSRVRAAGLAPLSLVDLPEPKLPNARWVRIAPHMAGICGSDLATIRATASPYLAPVTSMPFVMGHEVVGNVVEVGAEVERVGVGDRIVLHPALGCQARGINPPCDACGAGREALCRNVMRGDVSSGIQTGYCRDTGGGFGESLVAHESQVYRVPDAMSDEAAVLIEPYACAVHGALRATATESDTVFVIGCGSIGLLTIAALRATGCKARIVAAAKHDHQRKHALRLGADQLVDGGGSVSSRYDEWAGALDADVLPGEIGKPMVIGGAAVTIDCVATSQSIDDGTRFTKSGGAFVLVGMPGTPVGVDWTALWVKELSVHAAYAYGPERLAGGTRETFDLTIDLMHESADALEPLVGPPFALADYRKALACAIDTKTSGVVKTVFTL